MKFRLVEIGVCTFRRPGLTDTIESIAAQDLPADVRLRVIVADNDVDATRGDEMDELAARLGLDITYIHAPERNISIARNACLDAATADLFLFIDDDEVAAENWVMTQLQAAEDLGAGVVFGPAHAVYPDHAPDWMRENAFHSNIPVAASHGVETGASCNVLLDLSDDRIRNTRFREEYGRTGGEDVDFFFRLYRAGVTLGICQAAKVYESVAESRLSFSWLFKKSVAQGVIYAACATDGRHAHAAKLFLKGIAKSGYCMMRMIAAAANKTRSSFWALRGAFHYGVIKGCLMPPSREFYGQK